MQPPSAASGRRRLLAGQAQPIYDVGGAEHVAVNCTIYAAYRDLVTAQTTLSDSVKSGGFVQVLNQTGELCSKKSWYGASLQGVHCSWQGLRVASLEGQGEAMKGVLRARVQGSPSRKWKSCFSR